MPTRNILALLSAAFLAFPASGLEETIGFTVAGGSFGADDQARVDMLVVMNGTTAHLSALESSGIQVAPGFRGKPEIQMREAEYRPDASTDLLLHFNRPPSLEAAPNYRVLGQGMAVNGQIRRLGPASAIFNQDPSGLLLEAGADSLFAPGDFLGDFSIEFWFYPTTLNEGEQVLAWDGSTMIDSQQRPQGIRVEIRDRKLVWDFLNVFGRFTAVKGGKSGGLVLETERYTLKNKREILPRVWQHHLLRYNSRTGLLQYSINGQPEDMIHATVGGHEGGEVLRPYLGERSEPKLRIGAKLTGFLDELRLSRRWVTAPQVERFEMDGSWVIFNPIDFRDIGVGSKVLRIKADWTHPGTSSIYFYYKMAMSPGLVQRNDPYWIRFDPEAANPITEKNQGQYLYLKAELMADGSGSKGPGLQGLSITYQPDPPPPSPGGLVAVAADGQVTLRWNPVPVNSLRGYLVYYGTRPGQYFGEEGVLDGVARSSPVDVGKSNEVTIKGLQNGRIYYFCVASYNESNDPLYGIHLKRSLSKEVSARPAR
jgi:hypothetical protein